MEKFIMFTTFISTQLIDDLRCYIVVLNQLKNDLIAECRKYRENNMRFYRLIHNCYGNPISL